jgi:SAM-dependent methyltransferase
MKFDNFAPLGPPSKDLINLIGETKGQPEAILLDVGCGYGRNAVALALRGFSVVCVDQDFERLNALVRLAPRHFADLTQPGCAVGQLYPLLAKLGPSSWPFGENCFAGIVCVHFLSVALFDAFQSSLVPGGYLYIETFGGHGRNHLELPQAGQLRTLLSRGFQLPFYREKKVGPVDYDAVTVKLLARKRSSSVPDGNERDP